MCGPRALLRLEVTFSAISEENSPISFVKYIFIAALFPLGFELNGTNEVTVADPSG